MVKGIRTYAVLFLQQCLASCQVAWLFISLFVCCTYVYACYCNTLLYVKREWFSLSYTLIYLQLMKIVLKPFTNVITTMARNVCAPLTVVQRILPHCQHKAFANGFLSKRLCCITHWAQRSNMSMCVLHRQLSREFFHTASTELSLMASCQNVSVA